MIKITTLTKIKWKIDENLNIDKKSGYPT